MNGILTIYKKGTKQDWQREGFYASRDFGIKKCATIKGLPFFFDVDGLVLTVTEFKLQKIANESIRNEVIIERTINIGTSYMVTFDGIFSRRHVYYAADDISNFTQGIYQYYIKLSDNSEYISELIYRVENGNIIEDLPDFNNDWNIDYYTE